MKKIFTVIAFVVCTLMAGAQPFQRGDSLLWGQRWPSYYYWGHNWLDSYTDTGAVGCLGYSSTGCMPEYARYIYTDYPLRVIGVAVEMQFILMHPQHMGENPPSIETDYFRLYKVDTATGDMVLVAEKPLLDTSAACYIPSNELQPLFGRRPRNGLPVREVFFDSAVIMTDSFYVATTCNNNYGRYQPGYQCYYITYLRGNCLTEGNKPIVLPQPNHYRRKLHRIGPCDRDLRYGVQDTNWHVFHTDFIKYDTNILDEPQEWGMFMMMFPIIDTNYDFSWQPGCEPPVNLSAINISYDTVVLGWDSEGASHWELKVAKDGEDLDSVATIDCTNDVMPLYGLDTAVWYIATVRSICSDSSISEWGDTIRFFVPGDTTSTTDPEDPQEGIASVAERFTYMMPNPAGEQVTIMSSFRIDRVEIYSLTGQRVVQEKVGGLSSQIDISGLPKGAYLVRVHTNHGVSTKRLVVM